MNKLKSIMIATCVVACISLSSCNKIKDKLEGKTDSPVPTPITPTLPSDIDGALVCVRVGFTYDISKFSPIKLPIPVPPIDATSEVATALFGNLAASSYKDAGAVSVNSNTLDKLSNKSYVKSGFNLTSGAGDLGFSSGGNWSVGGSSDVTAFTYNYSDAFPTYTGKASMPENVPSTGVSFNISGINNADSIYVCLIGSKTTVIKHLGKTASSVSFSASDVTAAGSTGGKTTGFLEVCPFRSKVETINSKKYVFIKEHAEVKNVIIN
jgi:hypothetical protein